MKSALGKAMLGEFLAGWSLGAIGLCTVAVVITTGGYGLFELAMAFGFAIMVAFYLCASISGAHLNPAFTLSAAFFLGFPWKHVIPFWVAQIGGWFVGALTCYAMFGGAIRAFESTNKIVRGSAASSITAMIFNCYSPNPGFQGSLKWGSGVVPEWKAIFCEAVSTFLLIIMVYCFIDPNNAFAPTGGLFALIIGLVVAFLIMVEAPLTMTAINPARDYGPRLATWLLGWGKTSIWGLPSGKGGHFYIYWIGPCFGAICAGGAWKYIFGPCIPKKA